MKQCSACHEFKPFTAFSKYKNGFQNNCKSCGSIIKKEYIKNNKKEIAAKEREYRLIKKYGITNYEYDRMLNAQNGMCKVCGCAEKLVIDHNHNTGKIRGLLCNRCNKAMGLFRDDYKVIKMAINYIMEDNG